MEPLLSINDEETSVGQWWTFFFFSLFCLWLSAYGSAF